MLGASRQALVELRGQLDDRAGEPGFTDLPEQLFGVVGLLSHETALRNALADAGTPAEAKRGLAEALFAGQVGDLAVQVVADAVARRWSASRDLLEALESLGAQAAFMQAERDGTIDAVEEELFRFARTVEADSALSRVLTDPRLPVDRKVAVLHELLSGRAHPITLRLAVQVVTHPLGRRVQDALEQFVTQAAERREQFVAEVRVARHLEPGQERRLAAALARVYRREVKVQVVADPEIVGGAVVRVGDEVIDGSVAHKIEEARRRLTG